MVVCMECERVASEHGVKCSCGSEAQADVQESGAITAFYASGVRCWRCGRPEPELAFRRFRRVVGLAIFDSVETLVGYYCVDCRRQLFREYQTKTLIFGWWGLLAMLFRNPYAIAVNFKALRSPPRNAARMGAATLEEQATADAIASGEIGDTWECRACGFQFIGHDAAVKHADLVHTELRFDDAKAALVLLTE
jgi:hypothetical protein